MTVTHISNLIMIAEEIMIEKITTTWISGKKKAAN